MLCRLELDAFEVKLVVATLLISAILHVALARLWARRPPNGLLFSAHRTREAYLIIVGVV